MSCRVSDYSHTNFYGEDYSASEVTTIFEKGLKRIKLSVLEINKYKSEVLFELALMNKENLGYSNFTLVPLE